jgi:putative ABC transport system ATP-binding protein
MSALSAAGISKTFATGAGPLRALTDVSLSVEPGELLVLRGPSGSGKTTLLSILGGLDSPDSGSVFYGETDITTLNEAGHVAARRSTLGYVFQNFGLIPVLSAAENVELPLRIQGVDAAARADRVAEVLELVGLGGQARQRPYELSGGQQQRVGIARALVGRPSILLADEPTGQLDSATAGAMMDLFSSLVASQSLAAVISTHDPELMKRADTVVEIHDGQVVSAGRHGRHSAQPSKSAPTVGG